MKPSFGRIFGGRVQRMTPEAKEQNGSTRDSDFRKLSSKESSCERLSRVAVMDG